MLPLLASIDLVLLLVDRAAVLTTRSSTKPLSLLIIRLDVLGDYLLFRNYLRQVKESTHYGRYSITLLGNVAVKSLAETFDKDLIDRFIWVDIYRLSTQPLYRFRVVRQLRAEGFAVAFCPSYSRVLVLDDFMAWASGASERVGCQTDYTNIARWEAVLGNRLYTRLIDSGVGIVFELERDRRIVAGFLQEPVAVQPPVLDRRYARHVVVPEQYVVISLGAGQEFRIWPANRYAHVIQYIQTNYPNRPVILTGAPNEQPYADVVLALLPDRSNVIDQIGKLSIAELIYVVGHADLLITNETGIVHIAASTQTPTVVISQGKSLVRWHPYPTELGAHIFHIYPTYIEQHRADLLAIASEFNPESRFSMSEITVERVTAAISHKLQAGMPST